MHGFQPHGPSGGPTPQQAELAQLVRRIQSLSKPSVLGVMLGAPLTAGGAHYGATQGPAGFVAALVGAVLLTAGVLGYRRVLVLRRRLRSLMPAAQRSPVAHLPSARRAATLAAYVNGVLVLLGLGGAGWLLYMGASWGAYDNSFGFAALVMGALLPFALGLAAASTVPELLRVVPAGARMGQALYGVFVCVASLMIAKGDGLLPRLVGAVIAVLALGAIALLGRCFRVMGGAAPRPGSGSPGAGQPGPGQPGSGQPGPGQPGFGQPAPAPGFGPPTSPPGGPHGPAPYGPPAPPAPRAGRGGLVLVLVLVLVAVLGGGGLYAVKEAGLLDGDDSTTTDVAESPQAPAYGVGGERRARWATGAPAPEGTAPEYLVGGDEDVVVHVTGTLVTGYDVATGKKLWDVEDRSGDFRTCAVSPTAVGHVVAVLMRRGDQGPCGFLVAVDVRRGKQLWSKGILGEGSGAGMGTATVRVTANSVVSGTQTAPVVLDARSGDVRWTGADQPDEDGEARSLRGLEVAGNSLVASYGDGLGGSTALRRFDLRSGRVTARPSPPKAPETPTPKDVLSVLSVEPLVVSLGDDTNADRFYFSRVGDAWKPLRTDAVEGVSARSGPQEGMVTDGLFVKAFTTDDRSLDVGFDTVVAAFDLESGALRWQHALHRDAGQVVLLPGTVGGAVRAVASDHDTGDQLYAFPLEDGGPVRGGRLTVDASLSGAPSGLNDLTGAVVQGERLIVRSQVDETLVAFPFPSKA